MFKSLTIKSLLSTTKVCAVDANGCDYYIIIPWYLQAVCASLALGDELLCCVDVDQGDGVAVENVTHPFSYHVKKDFTITGNLQLNGAETIASTLTVAGAANMQAVTCTSLNVGNIVAASIEATNVTTLATSTIQTYVFVAGAYIPV